MIHVVLFRPEKPQNTGNIMRTCVAIGAHLHIIGPLTFSIDCKDLKRVGMDYLDDLKLTYYEDINQFENKTKNKNIFYISRYGDKTYSNADFHSTVDDIYVMFGRESTGIPHEILRLNKEKVLRLPMVPQARSLNLSNCVAIICFEILRQQNFPDLATSECIKGDDFLDNEFKKSIF